MHDSVGRQRLKEWIEGDPSRSQAKVARALGVKPPSVFGWINGTYRPDDGNRRLIHALTGIAVDDWRSEEEREKEAETLRGIAEANQPTGTDGD